MLMYGSQSMEFVLISETCQKSNMRENLKLQLACANLVKETPETLHS